MLIPIFPTLPQGFPAKWSPLFKTTIGASSSGRESRQNNQSFSLWQFELSFEVLRDQTQNATPYAPLAGFTDYMKLCQTWLSMYSEFGVFYFDAPWDDSRTNQLIGTGDGTTTGFVVFRTLGVSGAEITEPVGGLNTVTTVYLNGVPTIAYTVSGNAIIFNTAPGAGVVITATFSFYYVCRFTNSHQDFEEFFKNYWRVPSLKFQSVIIGGTGYMNPSGGGGGPPPAPLHLAFFGASSYIITSSDGVTWNDAGSPPYQSGAGGIFNAYGNGILFTLDSFNGYEYTSADGITWTQNLNTPVGNPSGVTFGAGLFARTTSAASPGVGGYIETSSDGNIWTSRLTDSLNTALGPRSIDYFGGLFVSTSTCVSTLASTTAYISNDGITWTSHAMGVSWPGATVTGQCGIRGGLSGGSNFFILTNTFSSGNLAFRSMTTPDGVTWTSRSVTTLIDNWATPCFRNTASPLWVTVGDASTYYPTDSNTLTFPGVLTSTDGISWTAQQIPIGTWIAVNWSNALGLFIAQGNARPSGEIRIATSPDGVTWTIQTVPSGSNTVNQNFQGCATIGVTG